MASQPERIAWGSLSGTSEVTVYTVPRQTRVVLASLILTNRGSENASVSAYVTVEDAAYNVLPSGLQLGAGDSYHLTTPIAIEANERLRLQAEPAGAVQYYVTATKHGAIPTPSNRGV